MEHLIIPMTACHKDYHSQPSPAPNFHLLMVFNKNDSMNSTTNSLGPHTRWLDGMHGMQERGEGGGQIGVGRRNWKDVGLSGFRN